MNNDAKGVRALFMGTGVFALEIFKALISEKYNIVGLYTRPAKKAGRKRELIKSELEISAEKNNIDIFTPEKFGDTEIAEFENIKCELIILLAYGKILPESILKAPKFGAINIHPSLLPEYRGPSPIQNAILDGKKKTGVTIMLMDKGIDTGNILRQKEIEILPDETLPEFYPRIIESSKSLLLETLPDWLNDKIEPVPQDDGKATLCQLIERSDGKIIWADDAENIYNRYRAFLPWPGIFTFWDKAGQMTRLKLDKISIMRANPDSAHKIGEVFRVGDRIVVKTNNGLIVLEEVQLEGKNKVSIDDFINGNADFLGSVLM